MAIFTTGPAHSAIIADEAYWAGDARTDSGFFTAPAIVVTNSPLGTVHVAGEAVDLGLRLFFRRLKIGEMGGVELQQAGREPGGREGERRTIALSAMHPQILAGGTVRQLDRDRGCKGGSIGSEVDHWPSRFSTGNVDVFAAFGNRQLYRRVESPGGNVELYIRKSPVTARHTDHTATWANFFGRQIDGADGGVGGTTSGDE